MSVTSQQEIQVLHVDDEPDFADLTTTFLKREDDRFTVETAHSADKGRERIDDRPPDCVVSDYNMPGMNGIEFLQAVREEYPNLPFILFTGKGSEAVASDAISAGVTDYLQKGSGSEQYELLANRIRNAVQARRETERADRQEQLMRLTEFAGDTGGFELDVDSGDLLLTDGTRRLVGLPDDTDLTLAEAIELYHPDDQADVRRTINQAAEAGEQTRGTWRLQTLDGDQRLVDMTITPAIGNNDVTTIQGSVHDVTERRERRQELEQVEALFEHTQDSLFLIDIDGEFTVKRVNPAYEAMTEQSADQLRGCTPQEILGEQQGATVERRYRDCVERREPLEYTEQLQFDGELTQWKTRIAPVVLDSSVEYIAGATRDVTHREERKQELRAVKNQYQTLVENSPNGAVLLYDTDLQIIRAGGTELSSVRLSSEEIEGTTPNNRYPSEIAEELVHNVEKAFAGDSSTFEQEYGGEHYRVQVVPVRTDDGEITCVMAVSGNITEWKERKQELKRYERLVENLPVGVFRTTIDGKIIDTNQAAIDLYDADSRAQLRETEVEELYNDDSDRIDLLDQLQETGRVENELVEFETLDGDRRFVRVTLTLNEETENRYIEGILKDVTDRRELEREFAHIKTIAESLNDALYVLNDDGQFTYVNDRFTELTGYSMETILGSTPELIKNKETVEKAEQQLAVILSDTGSDTVTFETTIQPDSGSPVVCEDHMGVLPYEGDSFNGSVGVLRDITERKRRERELRQERNRLDEFTSVVSHDLRNPLTVADGHLELAQETCESPHLAQAATAIDRSQALIKDLLTLAREGEDASEVEPVALADVAESSWQTVDSQSATLETHTTQTLQADQSRLTQLFENLYRNAIEHGGGDVTVSVGPMDGGFYVADTGPGIPEDDREEAFETGYSTNEDGTGFGLRIVKQVADAHGWEIAVTGSEQGGARFEVTGVEFADQ